MRFLASVALALLCTPLTLLPAWAGDPAPTVPAVEPAPTADEIPVGPLQPMPTAPSQRQRLCDNGDGSACKSLADAFSASGDYGTAMAYLDRACILEEAQACADAASAFLTGNYYGTDCSGLEPCQIIELDPSRGFTLAQKACSLQNPMGCYLKGFAYENGLGTVESHLTAIAVWRQNCKKRADGHSCVELGIDPPMPKVPKDEKEKRK